RIHPRNSYKISRVDQRHGRGCRREISKPERGTRTHLPAQGARRRIRQAAGSAREPGRFQIAIEVSVSANRSVVLCEYWRCGIVASAVIPSVIDDITSVARQRAAAKG